MAEVIVGNARRSDALSVGLALLTLGFALRVRPVSWMLFLCLIPVGILVGAAPTVLGFRRAHPRLARACMAFSILANLTFVVGVVMHLAHR